MIVDLSWPCGSLVNDGIPSGSFLGELLQLSYPTIDAIVSEILSLGRGCMQYKRDLRKAYHQFPVDPHDYHLLDYTWNSQFYFYTVLTMGLCFAVMACQRSMSAVTWILNQQGLSTLIYLDDFIGVSPPNLTTIHFNELGVLLHQLGLEESVAKSCPPSPVMTCLGVKRNTLNFTLSVDSACLVEIESLLYTWLRKRTTPKSSLQSLVGKLVFVSKCVRQSRVFVARILCLLRLVKVHLTPNIFFAKTIKAYFVE